MTSTDLALYIAQMVTAWVVGFTGGYTITRFRDAISKVS